MYELKITDKQWWCYDIVGNLGWIMYFIGLALCFLYGTDILRGNRYFASFMLCGLICAVVISIGIIELINERIHRLSRLLPKKRVYRGFGAIAVGSLGGTVISLTALFCFRTTTSGLCFYLGLMSVGAILCSIFTSLILKGFVKLKT